MAKYRTYNKLYFHGKPQGHAFVYHKSLEAKNESAARAKIGRINADWNKHKKDGYIVKTAKVVAIKRHGGVRTKRRRSSSPFEFSGGFRMPRLRF